MNDINYQQGSYTKGFVIGAIIGGAIGAITALLLAPKSGRELRQDLAQKSNELYGLASDYITKIEENVGSSISATVNEGKLRAENIIASAKRQAGEILSNAEKVLSDAKSKAANIKEDIQEKIDNIKDAAKAGAEAFKAELNSPEEQQS
ncbi:MAG: YtxH domain-containing protein [Candidatus Kapabacteria bacterium]|nr:YtxH domain-containing protein [Candidatus Kapabacteria bacterium]